MTAGQDEARAQALAILREFRMKPSGHQGLISLIASALSEARDQGARDRDEQIIEACRQKGNGGVPFISELTAKLPLPSQIKEPS